MNNLLKRSLLITVALSASEDLVQAAATAPPGLADVMHKESGPTGVQFLSLQDAIAHANSSPGTRNDFSLWDEIRRIHLPKLNTDYIKGYKDKNVLNLRTAILISGYVQRKLHDLLENRRALIDDTELMGRIDRTYTPQFAHALRGYLLLAAGRHAEVFAALEQAGPAVNVETQKKLNDAASNGFCGFNAETGRAYLEARIRSGDQHAQERLNDAAGHAYILFNTVTGRAYLEVRARDHSDQHAQQMLNEAALYGTLGFNAVSGRVYLEARARDHSDQHAQQMLNNAARLGYHLGFDDATGLAYLEDRVRNHGDQHAQQMLNEAARRGDLGFDATSRRALEARAGAGDQDAQQRLNDAARHSYCGFDDATGLAYLEDRVRNHGDQNAQNYLNEAALYGTLGFNTVSGRDYLEARILAGDQNAQESLNHAAEVGYFGFNRPSA